MTEKVKVSQAEFDWLEKYKSEAEIDYAINIQPLNKRPDSPIADWWISKVARALLYNGYEVEPEYKAGDWVANLDGSNIYAKGDMKVVEVHSFEENYQGFDYVKHGENGEWGAPVNLLRHATPEEIQAEKERRKWAGIEEGDVLRYLPMAHEIAIYLGDADDEYIIVENSVGQYQWPKVQVELYAKKVGGANE